MCHIQGLFQAIFTVIILEHVAAESRTYNAGYGLGEPINVGGESAYGLRSNFGSSNGFGLSSGLHGLHDVHNGYGHGVGIASGLDYGLATSQYSSSYPSSTTHSNFNSFQQNPFTQNAGSIYPSSNFGGSFYPGSGGYFGQSFDGYRLQRPLHLGNSIGNFILPASNGLTHDPGSGYPLGGGGYTAGLGGSQFSSLNSFAGTGLGFGNGLGFGVQHHFK